MFTHRGRSFGDFADIFLSRVSVLTRDIDILIQQFSLSACLSVRLSVLNVPVLDENGLTYYRNFFTIR